MAAISYTIQVRHYKVYVKIDKKVSEQNVNIVKYPIFNDIIRLQGSFTVDLN